MAEHLRRRHSRKRSFLVKDDVNSTPNSESYIKKQTNSTPKGHQDRLDASISDRSFKERLISLEIRARSQ